MQRKTLILTLVAVGLAVAATSAAFGLYPKQWFSREPWFAAAPAVVGITVAGVQKGAPEDLPVVRLGDAQQLQVGDTVLAIGSPFGLEQTATQGNVSAKGRSLPGDVLPGINGGAVRSVEQVRAVIDKKPRSVALLILRDGERLFVPVELD